MRSSCGGQRDRFWTLLSRPRAVVKGEITVLIGKPARHDAGQLEQTTVEDDVATRMSEGLARMDAIKAVARSRGLSKRDVYRQLNPAT